MALELWDDFVSDRYDPNRKTDDFRKFDDGLRMTLDCSPAFADALEARLAAAPFVEWGTVRQEGAR